MSRVARKSRETSRVRKGKVSARSSTGRRMRNTRKSESARLSRRKRRTEGGHPNGSKTPSGVTRPIGAPPERETVAGVRRDTGAGGWRLRTGVRRRRAIRARRSRARGRRAVAPRTVLEHLQQREGRDLDVLRGVHLRGIPRGRLGSAPHHTPATHHPGDVHRARFTCAWPVRVRREVDCARETRSDELCEIDRNSVKSQVGFDRLRPR